MYEIYKSKNKSIKFYYRTDNLYEVTDPNIIFYGR